MQEYTTAGKFDVQSVITAIKNQAQEDGLISKLRVAGGTSVARAALYALFVTMGDVRLIIPETNPEGLPVSIMKYTALIDALNQEVQHGN